MVSSEILIWNKEIGFIRLAEGTGDNLLDEDEAEGFVDYIMLYFLDYGDGELMENDGIQVMLCEFYQVKFSSVDQVIKHLIDCEFIPDVEYIVLYE